MRIREVTCTAEDSDGYLYPVTEDGYVGYAYEEHLPEVEDAAMDWCYDETGGDEGCHLVGCEVVYR